MKRNIILMLVLGLVSLLASCEKNNQWPDVSLDTTPVYYITDLKDENGVSVDGVYGYSVYYKTEDLIKWNTKYSVNEMNPIEFFVEYDVPESDEEVTDENIEKLSFSFNELFVKEIEVVNEETGETEIQEVDDKRTYLFNGEITKDSETGNGTLTVMSTDGNQVVYNVSISRLLKTADL